jgi:hypothetical protein
MTKLNSMKMLVGSFYIRNQNTQFVIVTR